MRFAATGGFTMRHAFTLLITGLAALGLSGHALAGTTLTYKSRDGDVGAVYSVTDRKLSSDSRSENATMLYDASTETITMIDHDERTYTVVTREALERVEQQMAEARKMQNEALKDSVAGLPKDMQEKILAGTQKGIQAGQTGLSKGMETRVERTGETDTVNGYDCEVIRLGVMFSSSEICLASNDEVGMPADAAATMKEMNEAMRRLSGSFMKGLGAKLPGGPGLDGVAVRTTNGSQTYILDELRTGDIDPAVFAVPDGYEKQELMTDGG
jgi:hypothetical protein